MPRRFFDILLGRNQAGFIKFVDSLMKSFTLIIAAAALFFASCEEEPPAVRFTEPEKPLLDTTYLETAPAAQDKNVLLFDITGVRCNNCPDAAAIARKIADTLHPGRVVVVALYPTSISPILTKPWDGYDTMNNADAEALTGNLGTVPSLPIGCVDQIKVSNNYYLDRGTWVGHVDNQIIKSTPVNIDINTSWDAGNNRGRLEAKVVFTQTLSSEHLIFIGVTESGVVGKQSDQTAKPSGYREDYVHNHALRKLYTATTGDSLSAPLVPGRVFEKHYYVTPRYNWNPDNLDVVVWVVNADTKEVLQVEHKHLK